MKTSIICPIGMSPPIVTELVDYVIKVESKFVSDVVLIATSELEVQKSLEFAKAALKVRYPKMNIHVVQLSFADITSTENNIEFMRICAKAIRDEREKYKCDYIYLNVAGGRKDMCISLSILAQFLDVDGVFHIIHPNVSVFNQMLERIRKEISDLYESEDKISFYRKHKEKFDSVMFPPLNAFNVIRIPIIPFPLDTLGEIAKLLCSEAPVKSNETKLTWLELKRLEKCGLIIGIRITLKAFKGGNITLSNFSLCFL
jgi:CRISPR-associated protein Csx14